MRDIKMRQNSAKKNIDSSAGSYLRSDFGEAGNLFLSADFDMILSLFGKDVLDSLFSGKIVHFNFDCPENLRKAFNKVKVERKESGCKILQQFMALYVLKHTLNKIAYGTTLSRLVDVPLRVGEVRFEQYVQSRPRRFGGKVVVVGGDNWYCALCDEHVAPESLPLAGCRDCPNGKCREFVFKRLDEEFKGVC